MASDEIGGYFELELARNDSKFPHSDEVLVNSGSHGFRLILRERRPRLVWLPDYTCDVMCKAAEAEGIDFSFYRVNDRLEIDRMPEIDPEKMLLVVNDYFGVKDSYVNSIVRAYPDGIVVDCAQSFMCRLPKNVLTIRSPRKFVGVPDGGIVKIPGYTDQLPAGSSRSRCGSLLTRLEAPASEGYAAFKEASATIHSEDITAMSALTRRLLESIEFGSIIKRRQRNFRILADCLDHLNSLSSYMDKSPEMPMVYPFMTDDTSLRQSLIDERVYVARYWPESGYPLPEGSIAGQLADSIVPLPIDQRYDEADMRRILDIIGRHTGLKMCT